MKVFACHLLNDYSGSPKVLMQLAKGWAKTGIEVIVVTCSGRTGFLSDIPDVKYKYYWYKWASNPMLRLFNLVLSQLFLFFKVLFLAKRNDIVYINTVLPFGAAIAGKLKNCKVIYHIHETSIKPEILKRILFGIVRLCASDVVYVSKYLSEQEKVNTAVNHILYNSIEGEFYSKAIASKHINSQNKCVLMISSLKTYKGVFEFVELARLNSKFDFNLVVNAKQEEIDVFFSKSNLPQNLNIFPTQTNTHPFYNRADVVINLSRPDGWVETFGLTILEAMAYGIPTIIPPVGGITELVVDDENGFLVDSRDLNKLSLKLNEILENTTMYTKMKFNALKRIKQYCESEFILKSVAILGKQNLERFS